MPRRFLLVWALFAILVSVQVSGCSLIGFGVGSAIDAARAVKMRPGQRSQVFKLEPGARLVARMTDGTSVAGLYRGLVAEPDSPYVQRYTAWSDTAKPGFHPLHIGEPIHIRTKAQSMMSEKTRGVFLGFGPRRVHFRPHGTKGGRFVTFDRIRWIVGSSGEQIGHGAIEQAADELPVQALPWSGKERSGTGSISSMIGSGRSSSVDPTVASGPRA